MPSGYVIWGQHDLPNHNPEHLYRSAYHTLLQAHPKLIGLSSRSKVGTQYDAGEWASITGFPYGHFPDKTHVAPYHKLNFNIAVVHKYIWSNPKNRVMGAGPSSNVVAIGRQLQAFDVALFGDNHSPFSAVVGKTAIWNGGTFIRRHRNEIDVKPRMGIIYSNGTVKAKLFDTQDDKFVTVDPQLEEAAEALGVTVEELVETLNDLSDVNLDFIAAMKAYLLDKKIPVGVRDNVYSLIESVVENAR